MALYQGLGQRRDEEREAAPAWRTLQARTRGPEPRAPFLDRLLGDGSTQVLGRSVGGAIASLRRPAPAAPRAEAAPRMAPAFSAKRLQAVGAGDGALPRGRKGVIRGLLLALGLCWAVLMLKPWQRVGALHVDVAALFHSPDPAEEARQAQAQRQREAAEAAQLSQLPLVAATGKPLGLWQDGRGRWFTVDGQGGLAPGEAPGRRSSLGLVELRGVAAVGEAHGQGRRLRLQLPDGLLKDLLPLRPGVASEAQALLLSEAGEPVLLTHEGTRCLLTRADWERQQDRLALVLADLAARKRRAAVIDLRYEDSAVVRPTGR